MDVEVEVKGLAEVVKKMGTLEQRVTLNKIRAAQRFAMKPAIDRAKSLVPNDGNADDDSYSLRDNIVLRAETKRNRAGNASIMRFGARRITSDGADPNGYAIRGGLGKGIRSPIYDQIVHRDTPFLTQALEQTQSQVVSRFGSQIVKLVDRL